MEAQAFFERYKQVTSIEQSKNELIEVAIQLDGRRTASELVTT